MNLNGNEYRIPQIFYARTEEKGLEKYCRLLIKPMDTPAHITLGTPFLRAFHIIVNYENNKIGFANKRRNFGAEIVGQSAPGNPRPWYNFGKEDAPAVIIKPDPVPVKPSTDDTKPVTPVNPSSNTSSSTNTTIDDDNTGIITDD